MCALVCRILILFSFSLLFSACSPYDEELNPEAREILHFSVVEIPAEQNAYVALVGLLYAQPGEEIIQRMQAGRMQDSINTEGMGIHANYRSEHLHNKNYLEELQKNTANMPQLLKDNQELLNRYQKMIQMPRYQNTLLLSDYIPNFIALRNLSDLYADAAIVEIMKGNTDKGFILIKNDISFYARSIKEEQLSLIECMIFMHIIDRYNTRISKLIEGNIVDTHKYSSVLEDIITPLPNAERFISTAISMERIGIFKLFDSINAEQNFPHIHSLKEFHATRKLFEKIYLLLFYKKNMTLNISYTQWNHVIKTIQKLPIYHFPQAWLAYQAQTAEQQARSSFNLIHLYKRYGFFFLKNTLGETLLGIAQPDYISYLAKAHDIHVYAHLVKAQLAIQQALPKDDERETFLAGLGPEARNPYTGEAFFWDKERQSLWFQPVAQKERREVRLR